MTPTAASPALTEADQALQEEIARAVDPGSWAAWDEVMSRRAKSWTMYSDEERAYYADAIAFVCRPGRKPSLEAAGRVVATLRARATAAEVELTGAWAIVGSRARENQQLEARATAAEDKLRDREAEIERLREAAEGAVRLLNLPANDRPKHEHWTYTLTAKGELRVQMPPGVVAEPHAALASTDHPASSEEATDVSGS